MTLQKFDFGTVATIDDGRIREALDQAIRRCELDCKDRPNVSKERCVTLKINLTPVPSETGDLDSVDVAFAIGDALPRRASKTYNMRAARGGLLFNEMSPDDVNQMTLPGIGPRGAKDDEPAAVHEEVADAQ